MIPKKFKIRRLLNESGLRLNTQIWLKAENCVDEIYKIIFREAAKWPNIAISTALIKEKRQFSFVKTARSARLC